MNQYKTYPAGQIEPGWQILLDDQWLVADIVIETETADGARFITILFEDTKRPAVRFAKTATVTARPPEARPQS